MKAVFMGTPDFSVPVLTAMAEHGIEIAAVVTQRDRPKGRGKGVVSSPVKKEAERLSLPVLQPVRVKDADFVEKMKALAPDVTVVVAFGQILSKEVLDIPRLGSVNVHASLLPKYRGAAPIQYAILNGEKETGVTTMFMDEGLDTGDMLLQEKIPIADDETGGSLFDKLSEVGAELLIRTLDELAAGTLKRTPQPDGATYVGMIKKSMGEIDWTRPANELERLVRGMNPWPSAFTYRKGKLLKIWKAETGDASPGAPGEIVRIDRESFSVRTGEGSLRLLEVQPEGKKRMKSADYLRGYPLHEGEFFGRKN